MLVLCVVDPLVVGEDPAVVAVAFTGDAPGLEAACILWSFLTGGMDGGPIVPPPFSDESGPPLLMVVFNSCRLVESTMSKTIVCPKPVG